MKNLFAFSAVFLFLLSCTSNQKQEQEVVVAKVIDIESTSDKRTAINFTEFKDILLLKPDTVNNDARLMDALKKRCSSRDYAEENLSLEQISNLLWAGYGVNRVDGRRTTATIYARYPIIVYAVFPTGIYLYDAEINTLQAIVEGDFRMAIGEHDFIRTAPLNLLLVANMNKYIDFSFIPENVLTTYAMADAAFISQNVSLYCAAADLATMVRVAEIDESKLLQLLKLDNKTHHVLLTQTVGYKSKS